MPSATINLFLAYGDSKRLRTAEISNWSGKAIAAPRTELDQLLEREETNQSGVYILTGTDPATGNPMAYIGEGEILRDRLKAHKSKDFWIQAIAFVSKDENLTKSHIRYLEGRLIQQAEEVGRYTSAARQHPFVVDLRQRLIDDQSLVEKGSKLIFTKNIEFTSPSSAAAVVHGGGASGLTSWKTQEGRTLKELENE